MNALSDKQIEKAYFVSPVVNMEKLITDMMFLANVTEAELRDKKENQNKFWRDTFMGLSLLCERESDYMENSNTYFIWRKR